MRFKPNPISHNERVAGPRSLLLNHGYGEKTMFKKNELYKKIYSLFPEIGEHGIDLTVDRDEAKQAWIVEMNLKKGSTHLKTHLEILEADLYTSRKQWVDLRMQIALIEAKLKETPNNGFLNQPTNVLFFQPARIRCRCGVPKIHW